MRWLMAAALLVAEAATAATWTCPKRTNLAPSIVIVYCQATGSYTGGGDTLGGGGDNTELCNSANRIPVTILPSSAASRITGQGYSVLAEGMSAPQVTEHGLPGGAPVHVVLLTAGNAPGAGVALTQLAEGTDIDGATFTALVTCK